MAITEDELEILRLVIQQNPNPKYMKALRESDEYARSEIALIMPTLRVEAQKKIEEAAKAQVTMDMIELASPKVIREELNQPEEGIV